MHLPPSCRAGVRTRLSLRRGKDIACETDNDACCGRNTLQRHAGGPSARRLWVDADAPDADAPAEVTALALYEANDALNQSQFSAGDMATTTWEQLALRVGSAPGYVYCHQGCCEHALYVADARRVHPGDPRARSAYPLQTFQACLGSDIVSCAFICIVPHPIRLIFLHSQQTHTSKESGFYVFLNQWRPHGALQSFLHCGLSALAGEGPEAALRLLWRQLRDTGHVG